MDTATSAEFELDIDATKEMLEAIEDSLVDFKPAMQQVRDIMVEGLRKNFQSRGGYLGEPWPGLAAATLERKEREGKSTGLLEDSGDLAAALQGGRGRATSATKTLARAGVNKDLFYLRMQLRGAKGARRGVQPTRTALGFAPIDQRRSEAVIAAHLDGERTRLGV